MTNSFDPTPSQGTDDIFNSTGIRIMTNKDGDILFTDLCELSYYYVKADAIQFTDTNGKAGMWDGLMEYIKRRAEAPKNNTSPLPTYQ